MVQQDDVKYLFILNILKLKLYLNAKTTKNLNFSFPKYNCYFTI